MAFDSESMTPPSSPILGYSGSKDGQTDIEADVVYCLNCKGIPKRNDVNFNPESYFLRRELVVALENLKSSSTDPFQQEPRLFKCFNGYLFDPLDREQLELMVKVCRKTVASLELLSDSSSSCHLYQCNYDATDDPDEPCNQDPWMLRKSVCSFLNCIVRHIRFYRLLWKDTELEEVFMGLKKSLIPAKDWHSVLKNHCGYSGGNEKVINQFGFWEKLEIRWNLLLIYGVSEQVVEWVMDDLIYLSWNKYSTEGSATLDGKQPFNCACVKEVWCMIRVLLDEIQPSKKTFWTFYEDGLQKCSKDVYFPIWLTSYLAQSVNYSMAGVYTEFQTQRDGSLDPNLSSSGYTFLRGIFKKWAAHGGKSPEITRLSFEFFKEWGGDFDIISSLWMQWISRLDRGSGELSNYSTYSTLDSWLDLIVKICEGRRKSPGSSKENLGTNNDNFFLFVHLIAEFIKFCNDKDLKKLKSVITMKLNTLNTNDFGELGIVRVSTLFLVLISLVGSNQEAISWGDRFTHIFTYGKGRNTPGRRKTILRAYCLTVIVFLRRKLHISMTPNAEALMKIVDELLCDTSSAVVGGEASKKDLTMIYIDLLENLRKNTPDLTPDANLGRSMLISTNFLMWLSKCGPNYVVRTSRALVQLTDWILSWIRNQMNGIYGLNEDTLITSPSEAKDLAVRIREKCLPHFKSCITQTENRIPNSDMEPIAKLGADMTLLMIKFSQRMNNLAEDLFEKFAICDKTSPIVSQYYIDRLFELENHSFIENSFSKVRWAQVWLRLIALDCSVPEELTRLIVGKRFSSTCSVELLTYFCKNSEWTKEELQQIIGPLTEVLVGVMNGTYIKDHEQSERVVKSIIDMSVILLKNLPFSLIYIKGLMTSVAHQFLINLVPPSWPATPPWERWSSAVLQSVERNLFDIFISVITYPPYSQDPFLTRKLQDIVCLAFFGFIKTTAEEVNNEHPILKILNFSEENYITEVQNKILPNVIASEKNVLSDPKFSLLFLKSVQMIRLARCHTAFLRLGTGVIRCFLLYPQMDRGKLTICLNSIVYLCLFGGSAPGFLQMAKDAFENAFVKEFAFRSQRCYNLCLAILKSGTTENGKNKSNRAKLFLKTEIIPMLQRLVADCEAKRGIGTDSSLRQPLESLLSELARQEVQL